MSKNFLFVLTVSMLLAAGFASCEQPAEEPTVPDVTANVPSAAAVDSLWDAKVMFDDTTQFELLHANLKWRIQQLDDEHIYFELVNYTPINNEPKGSGNMYKFCPFQYLYFSIIPYNNLLSNYQGFYSTFSKKGKGTLLPGERTPGSSFVRYETSPAVMFDEFEAPLEVGKLALIKINDIQYYVRFQVAVEYKDETHYYCLSDTLFGGF